MRAQANKHRRVVFYFVGDWVYLKLQPYRLKSSVKKINENLSACFYGPYHITKIISHMAYQLDLPSGSKIHPEYHTKGQRQSSTIAQYVVRRLEITNGARRRQSNRLGMLKVLIQWNDLPDFEATWKSFDAIGQLFPLFHLEDKMKLLGGVLLVDLILIMFH